MLQKGKTPQQTQGLPGLSYFDSRPAGEAVKWHMKGQKNAKKLNSFLSKACMSMNGRAQNGALDVPVAALWTVTVTFPFVSVLFTSVFTAPDELAETRTLTPPGTVFLMDSVLTSPFVSVLTSTFTVPPPSPTTFVVWTEAAESPVSTVPPEPALFPPVSVSASVVLSICAYATGERAASIRSV